MNAYELPTSLTVGEVAYPINYGWKTAIEIFQTMNNPNLSYVVRLSAMVRLLFPDWEKIPQEDIMEAVEKANSFLDCGSQREKTKKPRMMDWEQDAGIIIPAVNAVAGQDVRLDPNIHWWTFFGWYMGINDSMFSSVLRIRQKKAKGKTLDKQEQEFYRDNKSMIDLRKIESDEVLQEKENMMKWL